MQSKIECNQLYNSLWIKSFDYTKCEDKGVKWKCHDYTSAWTYWETQIFLLILGKLKSSFNKKMRSIQIPHAHFCWCIFHITKLQSFHFSSAAAVLLLVFCFDRSASYALWYIISRTNDGPLGTYQICYDRDIAQMTFASRKLYFISFILVPYYVLYQIWVILTILQIFC